MERAEVRSDETGEWAVIVPGEGRAARAKSQREAENAARRIVRSKGGGEVIIHAKTGRITDKQTVPAASTGNGTSQANPKKGRRLLGILPRR